MADNYTVLGSFNTSELQGGNSIVPVQEFQIQTKPSNVYFQFRRPTSQLAALDAADRKALIASVADQLATRIEEVVALPNVELLAYSQPTNQAGQLVDTITVYVQSDSGNSEGTVNIPMADIGPGTVTTTAINAEVAALNDAEGL